MSDIKILDACCGRQTRKIWSTGVTTIARQKI